MRLESNGPGLGGKISAPPVVALLAAVAMVSRLPGQLLNSQFWPEDGHDFFADAYNLPPLSAVLKPIQGYWELLPRVVAFPAVAVGLRWAPLLFFIVTIFIAVLPLALLHSSRWRTLIPSPVVRWVLSGVYVPAMPGELLGGITNAQWTLALLACMVLVAAAPAGRWWKAFDYVAILFAALTGPFVVLLLLVSVGMMLVGRRPSAAVLVLLAVGTITELAYIVSGHLSGATGRTTGNIGPDPGMLAVIFAKRVLLGPLRLGLVSGTDPWIDGAVCLLAVPLVAWFVRRSPWEIRLVALFALGELIAGLAFPDNNLNSSPAWTLLASGVGLQRYLFLPCLVWAGITCWLVGKFSLRTTKVAVCALFSLVAMVSVATSWSIPSLVDLSPGNDARAFDAAPKGSSVVLPLNFGWSMTLTKH